MHSTETRKINSAPRIDQQDKTIHMTFEALESPNFLLQKLFCAKTLVFIPNKAKYHIWNFPSRKNPNNHYSAGYKYNIKPSTSQMAF